MGPNGVQRGRAAQLLPRTRIDWPVVSPPPRRSPTAAHPVSQGAPAVPSATSVAGHRDPRTGRPRGRLTALQEAAVAELLRISPVADELGARFAAAGHQLHLVGGSVRDALL